MDTRQLPWLLPGQVMYGWGLWLGQNRHDGAELQALGPAAPLQGTCVGGNPTRGSRLSSEPEGMAWPFLEAPLAPAPLSQ